MRSVGARWYGRPVTLSTTYRRTGASRSASPASASCMTVVAVSTFVLDPIWTAVPLVASTPVLRLAIPVAKSGAPSPRRTANAAPGT
jgi:hypothetical protein